MSFSYNQHLLCFLAQLQLDASREGKKFTAGFSSKFQTNPKLETCMF